MTTTKTCQNCNITKDVAEFPRDIKTEDRKSIYCRSCKKKMSRLNSRNTKEYNQEYYAKNKDKIKAKRNTEDSKEKTRKNQQSWYQKNKDRINQKTRETRAKNKKPRTVYPKIQPNIMDHHRDWDWDYILNGET